MEIKQLRKYLSQRVKQLDKEWHEEAEKDTRKKASDYMKVANIEGQMNAMIEIQTMLSPAKKG